MTEIISLLIDAFFIYLVIGLLFGLWFVTIGVAKLDDGAKDTSWHFRLILLPGSIFIWVLIVYKLLNKKS